jgi:hypothetical protein
MNLSESSRQSVAHGVALISRSPLEVGAWKERISQWLQQLGLLESVFLDVQSLPAESRLTLHLTPSAFERWTPDWDTLGLAERLAIDFPERGDRLELEILTAMLASPVPFDFPSLEELESALQVRKNIVDAASKTFLSFDAYVADRPEEFWEYDEDRGYVVRPGKSMIDALRLATQPGDDGCVYSFSCSRATEYVIALGLAQEVERCNKGLLKDLQLQSERRAIRSYEFVDVFLKEYGSHQAPFPAKYYVPGDRVWFKNPDLDSSDAVGFEGSWVFYLGNGRFTDFWKRNKAFTLELKCLEMFHWRHSTYRDNEGTMFMDEKRVQENMRASEQDPSVLTSIYQHMVRPQDPRGVYADGGIIDPLRQSPRWVRPETTDIVLPDVHKQSV